MAETAEMAETADAIVSVRHVTFGYGREVVLDDVSLEIEGHDFLAILGPNGGGKTTLVKIILGLLRPWSGEVVSRVAPGRMGYVPQFSTFDRAFPLRVEDVVLLGRLGRRGLLRRASGEDRDAVRSTLRRLRLDGIARSHVAEISGGQLQRVLIARTLVSDPEILFLDEPTASIDAESREVLRDLLAELNERIPVVVVTHDVTSLAPMVRRIACINQRLWDHGPELDRQALEEVYGCPVELIAHGVAHRVLHDHDHS
jgi:zinc transport system ATP-binding protein